MTPLSVEELAALRRLTEAAAAVHHPSQRSWGNLCACGKSAPCYADQMSNALPRLLDTIEALQGALSVERIAEALEVVTAEDGYPHSRVGTLNFAAALLAALKGDSE